MGTKRQKTSKDGPIAGTDHPMNIFDTAKAALRKYEQWVSQPTSTRDVVIGIVLVTLVFAGLILIVIMGMDTVRVPSYHR